MEPKALIFFILLIVFVELAAERVTRYPHPYVRMDHPNVVTSYSENPPCNLRIRQRSYEQDRARYHKWRQFVLSKCGYSTRRRYLPLDKHAPKSDNYAPAPYRAWPWLGILHFVDNSGFAGSCSVFAINKRWLIAPNTDTFEVDEAYAVLGIGSGPINEGKLTDVQEIKISERVVFDRNKDLPKLWPKLSRPITRRREQDLILLKTVEDIKPEVGFPCRPEPGKDYVKHQRCFIVKINAGNPWEVQRMLAPDTECREKYKPDHFDPMVDFCMSFAHKERAEDELEEILLNHLINLRVKQQGNITAANVTRFNAYRKRYLNRRKCPTMKRTPTGHCDFGEAPSSGACRDDIGSPVMCESSRRWFLVGWVGYGLCGQTPDVVSNYTFYQKWIEHIVSLQ